MENHLRHHNPHLQGGAFGSDRFGVLAERFARFFGTPKFIIGQTIVVLGWIILNGFLLTHWHTVVLDPYPFILLNLLFSTQAAYAAPLILLAQTRQADRDKNIVDADAKHREELAQMQMDMLKENTELTKEIQINTCQLDAIYKKLDNISSKLIDPQ